MIKIYLKENGNITRVMDVPKVPSIGDTFNFLDTRGPELDYSLKVVGVIYEIQKSKSMGNGNPKVSKLERVIVTLE